MTTDEEQSAPDEGGRSSSPNSVRRSRRGEQAMVPSAEFRSYYGEAILKAPVWRSPDIPAYLYLGGLAGVSSVVAAGAQITGRPVLARGAKLGAAGAIGLGVAGLVHDLGRPRRLLNMLRVFKPTSPMSVGTWLLAAYGPLAGAAAFSEITGALPAAGAAATAGAALFGPAVASYTAALLSDTAVPAWHDGYRQMPFIFVGSAATAAAGLGLVCAPVRENTPVRRLAVVGAVAELAAAARMERRLGMVAEPYKTGRAGTYMRAGQLLSVTGLAAATLGGGRNRAVAGLSGAALMAASACTRWGIFHAGRASANDPRYTVIPQRAAVPSAAPESARVTS